MRKNFDKSITNAAPYKSIISLLTQNLHGVKIWKQINVCLMTIGLMQLLADKDVHVQLVSYLQSTYSIRLRYCNI